MNRGALKAAESANAELRIAGPKAADAFALKRFSALNPRIIVIGASTGGPQALEAVLKSLAPSLGDVPVVVVLHMPANFTEVVAAHTARATGRPAKEAKDCEELKPGHIYFAGGNAHLKVIKFGKSHLLTHWDGPAENFCKPAVDVLFRSVAQAFGPGALAIVLTGMGSDGLLGAEAIAEAGGSVIAQDEASSVVWGMPGAVARAGVCAAVLPVGAIAGVVAMRLRGERMPRK